MTHWQAEPAAAARPRPLPKLVLRLRMCLVLALLDVLALGLAFLLTSMLPFVGGGGEQAYFQFAMAAPIFLVVALFNRAYSPILITDAWISIGRGLRALAATAAAIVLIAFFLKTSANWSRSTFIVGIGLSAMMLTVLRYAFGRNTRSLIGGDPYEVVVLHDGEIDSLTGVAGVRGALLGGDAFDPTSLSPVAYDRFAKAIEHADRVVVHCAPERRYSWARALKGASVQGEVVTPEIASLEPLGAGQHDGQPTLVVSRGPLGIKDRLIKRAFDLALAGAALVFLAPLMLAVALVIRLQDGGPVFFRQTRVGLSNRLFQILKFRSMTVAGSDGEGTRSASRDDDRITGFGRIIRSTSIDELPQLINVLKGDMSVVGPRPHALGSTAEDELFWHIDERYWHRHAVKPGLTGLAQVRGFRGATHRKEDLVNRLHCDLEYLGAWTIWRDMVIVLRTLAVLFHRNAY